MSVSTLIAGQDRASSNGGGEFSYSSDYQELIWRGCAGRKKPCGQFGIYRLDPRVLLLPGEPLPDWAKGKNKVEVNVSHPCTRNWYRSVRFWETPVFFAKRVKGKGYRFHYRHSRGGFRFTIRGVFRGKWVKGVMKMRNRANGCHTGDIGFRTKEWRPPDQA